MQCKQADNYMMKYFDDGIDELENIELKKHLSLCENCRIEYEQLSSILNDVEKEVIPEPSENFEENVIKKIKHMEANKKLHKIKVYKYLNIFAVIAAFIIVTALVIEFRIVLFNVLYEKISTFYPMVIDYLTNLINNFNSNHSELLDIIQPKVVLLLNDYKYYFYVLITFIGIYVLLQEASAFTLKKNKAS